eukprot:CAMPEP_0174864746 /NCGR_PEP_ID=MMETSP1114-20130205/59082_1 /TAXON_ID=312471 /ORGANISM="Neobodo designis, Strain CCAP 1951/1" /LENGTH=442 /DNA_ID=CAMNT_0016099855 /DNA_START=46 /DNA_END=1370 /DNA_ORIENTATION=+
MGATNSTELGEDSLAQELRERGEVLMHRLQADDAALTELAVPNHGVGDSHLEQAAAALSGTTHLVSLDLAYNCIGPRGVAHLCTALQKSTCGTSVLQELRLSGNAIGVEGCRAVCEWLDACRETCALRSLYLYQCDLDDECALLLANALQKNRSITSLNLDMNRFTKKTPKMLAQMLKTNRSLARLSFDSPLNVGSFPVAVVDEITEALATNAEGVARREFIEDVKRRKAQRRAEREELEKRKRDAALAEERRRVEEELAALEELKRQEDEQVRALEAKMADAVAKRQEKAAKAQSQRQEALERAVHGAYEWRNKMTCGGTLQKEWRSGFTIMKAPPGEVGATPTESFEGPRRLKACWCEPQDATAPYAKQLHYHCKWEEARGDGGDEPATRSRKGDTVGNSYMGCKATGHICASVGFYAKPRPDLSAPHFFASAHPGAAKT